MRVFVGFTGVKQAGKSTSFQYIKEKFPFVQEVALANKLKKECSTVFGIPRNAFDDPAVKEKELEQPVYLDEKNVPALINGFGLPYDFDLNVRPHMGTILHTPRQIAQYVGTEILRSLDSNVHCKGSIFDLPQEGFFVVTDMRFPNEFEFFAESYSNDFYPFYICNHAAEAKAAQDTHASEKHVLDIAKKCERIDNNGNLSDLKKNILKAFQSIWIKYQR